MDLCTVSNKKYIKNAINLINSYIINSFNQNKYVYCFDMSHEEVTVLQNSYQSIAFKLIPKVTDYAYDPTVFFYKTYALHDCINNSNAFIYSDATNVFNKFVDINKFLLDDSLFLIYNNEKLLNKFWTTKKCFDKMDSSASKNMMQYWAGFQAYISTEDNKKFVKEMYNYMLDPDVALPNTSIKSPDGYLAECIEHRQDQSVLSILINKHNRHQRYDMIKQQLFGDWQTYKFFDNTYCNDLQNSCLSSRESKYGAYRFL